ncbi:flagellar protein FliO/FliZ [Carnobacterium iners]|uniref:Flagellar protein FliO/FliZ n=1 Tax=Carnobacterium iners TaxID=1073423 RepID=A0A1X7N2E8_9LACT|nr:flagellar biosynthetic protein FliO [Carnobacterium iners]SEK22194.1 flagellar protein FliO/FliZ [Carnobacterium iners]SMH30845.1 flagellar protein FliO/FliZ [Carnobacterium iners]
MGLGVGSGYVVKSILALVVIIFIANYSLKYLNTFMTKKGKAIRIIERTAINKSSSICIVEIAGTYYVMSFTETRNEILRELTGSEKEAVIQSQELEESNQESPDLFKGKPTQVFKELQTWYQNFYEKRK